jgi:hypothetical protein
MKRKLYFIGGLTLLAFLVLFTLNASMDKRNKKPNGFDRSFDHRQPKVLATANFNVHLTGVAQLIGDTILFTSNMPGKLYRSSLALKTMDTLSIELPRVDKLMPMCFTTVAYPNIYLLGGNAKCLILGNLLTRKSQLHKLPLKGVFTNGIMYSPDACIMRVIDRETRNARFTTYHLNGGITEERNLTEPLGDAGFTHNGRLVYDAGSSRFLLIHYYDNQITCFDTNLNLVYKARTIDTNTVAKLQIKKGEHGGVTHKAAAFSLISKTEVYNGVLYVKSRLAADNEQAQKQKQTTFDKYETSKGKYLGSFYIPYYKGQEAKQFKVLHGNRLLALYGPDAVLYQL